MKNILRYGILVLSILLGAFFIYKGLTKHWLSPCKVYAPDSTIPLPYQQVMTAFCESGFLRLVGAFQILSGLLLLLPRTRLLGALMLLPIIFNIFFMHAFMDNRPEELVETGLPLAATLLILLWHFPDWRKAFMAGRA